MNFDFINDLCLEELRELQSKVKTRIKDRREEDRILYRERLRALLLEMGKNKFCLFGGESPCIDPNGNWDVEDLL